MKLSDFMDEEFILLDIPSVKKEDIIKDLVSPVIEKDIAASRTTLIKAILQRESLGSTAIGGGVAIPHAKSPCVRQKVVVFGRAKNGRDFDAVDGKPVKLFFMIVSPPQEAGPHLKMLARISRLLQDSDFRDSLMELSTPRQIIEYIKSKEI